MYISTQYREDEIFGGVMYLTIEADVLEDIETPWQPDVQLISVRLNDSARLIIDEIEPVLLKEIHEQVLTEYGKRTEERPTKRTADQLTTRNNGGGGPAAEYAVHDSETRLGVRKGGRG